MCFMSPHMRDDNSAISLTRRYDNLGRAVLLSPGAELCQAES